MLVQMAHWVCILLVAWNFGELSRNIFLVIGGFISAVFGEPLRLGWRRKKDAFIPSIEDIAEKFRPEDMTPRQYHMMLWIEQVKFLAIDSVVRIVIIAAAIGVMFLLGITNNPIFGTG